MKKLIWILLAVISLSSCFHKAATAIDTVDMTFQTTEKILDADKAIYNYEWFKRQEESIKALYEKEEAAKMELDDFLVMFPDKSEWDMFDKQEYSRLRANVTEIEQMTSDAIAEYNAKSNMVSRSIFKDNLPVNISRGFYARRQMLDGGD